MHVVLLLQVLQPRELSKKFFDSTGITSFGTEAIFLPFNEAHLELPVNKANLSADVYDLDQLRSRGRVKIGSVYGGIECTEPVGNHPIFRGKKTDAASRLIDVYVIFKDA